ncbi:MAG: helix-turn-helix domain-containing protein [Methyloprofundus sp.]|nr:helix-turn-helix domain-containing protein [Methyloprofundus sp.]
MLDAVIKHFGSQAELARRLGVDRAAVNQWMQTGLPARRAVEIEKLTNGQFRAVDLVRGYADDEQNL